MQDYAGGQKCASFSNSLQVVLYKLMGSLKKASLSGCFEPKFPKQQNLNRICFQFYNRTLYDWKIEYIFFSEPIVRKFKSNQMFENSGLFPKRGKSSCFLGEAVFKPSE